MGSTRASSPTVHPHVRGEDAAGSNGKTALHYAVAAGHSRVVELLLSRGADPSLLDRDGNTAFGLARAAGGSVVLNSLCLPLDA